LIKHFSQLGSVCAFSEAEPDGKQNKNGTVVIPFRCEWIPHTKCCEQQKYKNLHSHSCPRLLLKGGTESLVAGVSKYGLDFRACTSRSIYMINVCIFSRSFDKISTYHFIFAPNLLC
jgi:hypothetical protein